MGFVAGMRLKFVKWHSRGSDKHCSSTGLCLVFEGVLLFIPSPKDIQCLNSVILHSMNRDDHTYLGATGFPQTPSPGHKKRHVLYVKAEWLGGWQLPLILCKGDYKI